MHTLECYVRVLMADCVLGDWCETRRFAFGVLHGQGFLARFRTKRRIHTSLLGTELRAATLARLLRSNGFFPFRSRDLWLASRGFGPPCIDCWLRRPRPLDTRLSLSYGYGSDHVPGRILSNVSPHVRSVQDNRTVCGQYGAMTSPRFRCRRPLSPSRAGQQFSAAVDAVPVAAWGNPSPCDGWTALDVVSHVATTQLDLLFGPEHEVLSDASEQDRFLAWTGRKPV